MSVTIIDVAKLAGVSKTTVSAVLCEKKGIKPETRDRVMEAIEELHYVPNFNARNFVRRRTNILGALVLAKNPERPNYRFERETGLFSQTVISGITARLTNTGYGLITEMHDPRSHELPQMVRDSRVDGMFVIGSVGADVDIPSMLGGRDIPVVVLGTNVEDYDSFSVDIEEAFYIAVKHLIEGGHKNIGLINCSMRFPSYIDRITGYRRALGEAGIAAGDELIVYTRRNTGAAGMAAAEELFARTAGRMPDALVCANISATMGAMRCLYSRAMRVPEDISVIGHDDSVIYGYSAPGITATNIRKEEMGGMGAEVMLRRIEGDTSDRPLSVLVKPYLVERESVRDLGGII